MIDWLRTHVLRLMRVPPDPTPPMGAPGSVRVFRAGRNLYKLRLIGWGFGQLSAVAGIVFSLFLVYEFRQAVDYARSTPPPAPVVAPATPTATTPAPAVDESRVPEGRRAQRAAADAKRARRESSMRRLARSSGGWLLIVIAIAEVGGILFFLVQLPVTFAAVRLGYELHWYIVTDRSLRIRTGLLSLQESTMSFANLQQVEVQQGPLQRLLGLADVRVQSAGGGGDHAGKHGGGDSLHTGVFHGVENANEIRDLILDRLRTFRATGLGDPDEATHHTPTAPGSAADDRDALAAAQELLAEARALRGAHAR